MIYLYIIYKFERALNASLSRGDLKMVSRSRCNLSSKIRNYFYGLSDRCKQKNYTYIHIYCECGYCNSLL